MIAGTYMYNMYMYTSHSFECVSLSIAYGQTPVLRAQCKKILEDNALVNATWTKSTGVHTYVGT